jgi:hypothetical protein
MDGSMTSIQIDRTDGLSSSVAIKGPCKAATVSNITLSGEQTIDDVSVVTGDRVLVKDQTSGVDNGIWKVSTGVWTRSKDFSGNRDVKKGTVVTVTDGAVNAGLWQVATTGDIAIGTTSITFAQTLQPNLASWAEITRAAGFDTFVATPTSDNFKALLTDDAIPTHAPTRTAMKALDTTKDTVCNLTESGRQGVFVWTAGNFSTQISADTREGVYVKANAIASTAGAWVRVHQGILNVLWFGALGDNSNDDQPAFAAAYAMAKLLGTATTEGPCGFVWAPPGYRYKFGASLSLDVPVKLKVEGEIFYTPTTGAAVIVGSSLHTSRGNTQYDIDLGVVRAVNGNSVAPTGINTSGSIGVELRDVQFSRISVAFTIAFTYAGIYANASNNVFTGQHIQDNWIWHGEAGYCGVGFLAESHGAADGAFQVNEVHIQNSFSNWNNIVLGKSGDANTNNNMFFVAAADADTGGGNTILWSSYNFMQFGYISGSITLQASTFYNKIYHQVGTAQCTVTDSGTGNLVQNNVEGTLSLERWRTTGTTALQRLESTDAGATVADMLDFYRNSASPANNDAAAALIWSINDDAAAKRTVARLYVDIPTVAAANLNSRFRWETTVGNTQANRMTLWQGLILGAPTNGDLGAATINIPGTADYYIDASPLNPTVVTKTADFTVGLTENNVVCNKGSTLTVTLPSAATFPKRKIRLKTIQAFTVVSASSNVVPLTSATAGTAILAATAGKWADLQSDGTNWIIMAGN